MKIQFGINSNCSEIVYQICGVNRKNVDEYRKLVIKELEEKYTGKYLREYLDGILEIKPNEDYALGLTDNCDDWDALVKASKGRNDIHNDYLSCCSDYIESNEEMKEHMKYREDYEN